MSIGPIQKQFIEPIQEQTSEKNCPHPLPKPAQDKVHEILENAPMPSNPNLREFSGILCGKTLWKHQGRSYRIHCLQMIEEGKKLVFGGGFSDQTLKVLDLDKEEYLFELAGHANTITGLAMLPNEKILSSSNDDSLKVWDLRKKECILTIKPKDMDIGCFQINEDKTQVLVGSELEIRDPSRKRSSSLLGCFDLATGNPIFILNKHSQGIHLVRMSKDGKKAVSCSADRSMIFWDLDMTSQNSDVMEQSARVLKEPGSLPVRFLEMDSTGTKVLCVRALKRELKLFDFKTGTQTFHLVGHTAAISCLLMTESGKLALSGAEDGEIKLWDLSAGECIFTLVGHVKKITCLETFANETRALSGAEDGEIKLWDLTTGKRIFSLVGHTNQITSLQVSPDKRKIISGSFDGSIKIWDLPSLSEEDVSAKNQTV